MKKEQVPRCIQIFEQSVNSPTTRKNYRKRLDAFMKFAKISDYNTLVKTDLKQLQLHLENYVISLKRSHEKGDFRARSFNAYLAAIEAFFVQNDITLNFKKVKKWIPRYEKLTGEEPYTSNDIKKMLAVANTRWRSVIHFFASTGARPESVFELKKKHLKPYGDGCTLVTFYESDNEEYYGFLTREATAAVNEYFSKREFDGEKLTDDSPVFRNAYRETQGWKNVKHSKIGTAYSSFAQLLSKAGLRKIQKGNNKIRHSKRIFYGFRKRFNTILKDNKTVNANTAEKLMGHKNGLDGVYYNPTVEKRFEEFQKAMPQLIIDDSERLGEEKKKLENEKSKLEKNQEKIYELEKGLNVIGALFAEQQVKNNIWKELEFPTHHHTEKQKISLKKYCSSPPPEDLWKEFISWSKNDPKV